MCLFRKVFVVTTLFLHRNSLAFFISWNNWEYILLFCFREKYHVRFCLYDSRQIVCLFFLLCSKTITEACVHTSTKYSPVFMVSWIILNKDTHLLVCFKRFLWMQHCFYKEIHSCFSPHETIENTYFWFCFSEKYHVRFSLYDSRQIVCLFVFGSKTVTVGYNHIAAEIFTCVCRLINHIENTHSCVCFW